MAIMTATNAPCSNVAGQRPLVSAVIPTRNRPDLVCRAVRSALAQTYPNIEVVVVVDGPDPATVEALEAFCDPRIRTVSLARNVGGGEARNIGVREARGEFIALLDDDDEWLPTKTEKQLQSRGQSGSMPVLVVSRYFARSSDGSQTRFPLRFPNPGQPISEYMFAPYSGFQTSTFFCRRDWYLELPFATGLAGCQDLDWFLRAATRPGVEIGVVAEPLAIFNIPENRPSTSRKLNWKRRLQWGRDVSKLMTRRGYSAFILRVCLQRMIAEGFNGNDLLVLCKEYFQEGEPTLFGTLQFCSYILLPRHFQKGVRRFRSRFAL